LVGLLRQSVFGRLAGYEGVNDAERLCRDPAMRWVVGDRRGMPVESAFKEPIGQRASRARCLGARADPAKLPAHVSQFRVRLTRRWREIDSNFLSFLYVRLFTR